MIPSAPQYPAGAFEAEAPYDPKRHATYIAALSDASATLQAAVFGLSEDQLDIRYRNWTVRQIVHHLADSHVNAYIRFKWALTEERPTIKAYHEGHWAALEDSRTGAIAVPLALFEAANARWVQLLRTMTAAQFARDYLHPETGATIVLTSAIVYYGWHARHHTGQISWLRAQHGW